MSRHHAAHAGDVRHILHDIETMPQEDAERIYGIEFWSDGKIFDDTYGKVFKDLGQWVDYIVEQEEIEFDEDINRYGEDLRKI